MSKKRTKASIKEGDVIRVTHLVGLWRVEDKLSTQLYLTSTSHVRQHAWVFMTDEWVIEESMS